MKTRYVITKDPVNELGINLCEFDTFNKEEIEREFKKHARELKPGESLEYWKHNNKYAYIPLLTVHNVGGELKREVLKGNKVYYKSYDL